MWCDKDVCGRTALHDAVVSGSTAIVKVLVTRGIDINAKDFWVSVTYFASITLAAAYGARGINLRACEQATM
jgi:Ankyrin repeats (3 copies)